MADSPSSDTTPERGRIARPARLAAAAGWTRWLPGLNTLRHYDPAWLRHDIVAGLVMTTMLVPVGIAYAVASGVPGINGLYATIVPLFAYALFGPSRIIVLGPDSALAAVILAVVMPLSAGDPPARSRRGRNDGHRLGRGVHCSGPRSTRLHHRAPLEADSLRLHERHRADGGVEPDPEALWFFRLRGRTAPAGVGHRQAGDGGKHEPRGARGRRQHPRADPGPEAPAARPGHVDRRHRSHCRGRGDLDLATRFGISVLGPLPQGLPTPRLPIGDVDSLLPVLTGGVAVALVSFADTSVLSRTYAARLRTPVES